MVRSIMQSTGNNAVRVINQPDNVVPVLSLCFDGFIHQTMTLNGLQAEIAAHRFPFARGRATIVLEKLKPKQAEKSHPTLSIHTIRRCIPSAQKHHHPTAHASDSRFPVYAEARRPLQRVRVPPSRSPPMAFAAAVPASAAPCPSERNVARSTSCHLLNRTRAQQQRLGAAIDTLLLHPFQGSDRCIHAFSLTVYIFENVYLREFDIAKNEEAIAIQPNLSERCFDNMATAWRVSPFPQGSYRWRQSFAPIPLSVAG
jgi:hypothetical protein